MEYMSGGNLFSFIKKHREEGRPAISEKVRSDLVLHNSVIHTWYWYILKAFADHFPFLRCCENVGNYWRSLFSKEGSFLEERPFFCFSLFFP